MWKCVPLCQTQPLCYVSKRGPAAAVARQNLRVRGPQVELTERFEKGLDLSRSSMFSHAAKRFDKQKPALVLFNGP